MISLRLLRYVTAAADCANVTEAARRLQVSQPSVSAAIAELEQLIGVTIFVRHHAKGVTLTPAGERIIAEAKLLLEHAEQFSKTAGSFGRTDRGEITVGCFPTLAAVFMPSIMAEFAQSHPLITLRLEEGNHEQLMHDLAQGRIEIALSLNLGVPQNFETRSLVSIPIVVSLSENHRLANAPDVSLTELANDPLLYYDSPGIREWILKVFDAVSLKPNISFKTTSFELVRGLVGRGHGYCVHASVPLTTETYEGGRLVVKRIRDDLPPAEVVSITAGSQSLRPVVKVFEDFLEAALKRNYLASRNALFRQ